MSERITIGIPYSEVTYGNVYLNCVIGDGITKEEFIAGVHAGTIDPLPFAREGEEWTAEESAGLEMVFRKAEVIDE